MVFSFFWWVRLGFRFQGFRVVGEVLHQPESLNYGTILILKALTKLQEFFYHNITRGAGLLNAGGEGDLAKASNTIRTFLSRNETCPTAKHWLGLLKVVRWFTKILSQAASRK